MNRVERAGGVKPTYPVIHVLWAVGFLAVEVVAAVRHGCDELRRTDEWVNNDKKLRKREGCIVEVKFKTLQGRDQEIHTRWCLRAERVDTANALWSRDGCSTRCD